MDTILQSQVFFFISSIGFVFLWILIAIFLFYLIRTVYILFKIMRKIEKDIEHLGDTTKEMLEEIKNNSVFNFLFGRKKKYHKKI